MLAWIVGAMLLAVLCDVVFPSADDPRGEP